MRSPLLPILACFFFFGILNLQAQNFEWATSAGSIYPDAGSSITLDHVGNVYTLGDFFGTVDFDPGAGVYNLTSAGQNDVFIQKLDASGNLIWAKSVGGSSVENGLSVAIDDSGNVYVTGRFWGVCDFDPDIINAFNLSSVAAFDIFVFKLDSSGIFKWAKAMGGTNAELADAIAVDHFGSVFIAGVIQDTTDLNPDSGIYNITSRGMFDVFIEKLDNSGNFLWVKQFGGVLDDAVLSITTDSSGNVYATGKFQDTVDFDPSPNVFNLIAARYDIFVLKLNNAGDLAWAKSMGGPGNDVGYSVCIDPYGSVLATGYFKGTADFDPGPGIHSFTSVSGFEDVFIVKLNGSGNFIWAKAIGSNNDDAGNSIASDAFGNVYTTGKFYYTVDFNPGNAIYNITSAGGWDIFILKLDASGNFIYAKAMGGPSHDYGIAIAADSIGRVFATGSFNSTVADFDPGPGVYNLTSAGGNDIFVLKLSASSVGVNEIALEKYITISPNPVTNEIRIQGLKINFKRIELYNLPGEKILEEVCSMNCKEKNIDVSRLAAGMYFVKVYTDLGSVAMKIVKE